MFFFKNHAENKAARLVSDLLWLFKKSLNETKASGQQLNFDNFGSPQLGYAINLICIKFLPVDLYIFPI